MSDLLCVAIMVKNEEERLERTLLPTINYVNTIVILDTGSKDNTIEKARELCKKYNKKIIIDTKPFIDFSHNRNILLKMCEGLSEFILLLDANEEIKNQDKMIEYLENIKNKNIGLIECKYVIDDVDENGRESKHSFNRCGIIRNNIEGIFYEFPVHEYLVLKNKNYIKDDGLLKTSFYIYQDRNKDKSSIPRYKNDIIILNKYINSNPYSLRAYRYLVQTYHNLKDYNNVISASNKLINIFKLSNTYNFTEEYLFILLKKGYAEYNLGNDNFYKSYLTAYKYCKPYFDNAEPLYSLAHNYINLGKYDIAHSYIKKCCKIDIPNKNNITIAFDELLYDKYRWEMLLHTSEKLGNYEDRQWAFDNLHKDENLEKITDIEDIDFSKLVLTEDQKNMFREQGWLNDDDTVDAEKIKVLYECGMLGNISFVKNSTPIQEELEGEDLIYFDKDVDINKLDISDKQRKIINKLFEPESQEELLRMSEGSFMYLITTYTNNDIDRLKYFTSYMSSYLKFHKINFNILAIKKDNTFEGNKTYNKIIEMIHKKGKEKVYLCFQELDVLPIKGVNYYKPKNRVINHIYGSKGNLNGIFTVNIDDYINQEGLESIKEEYKFKNKNVVSITRKYFNNEENTECFEKK